MGIMALVILVAAFFFVGISYLNFCKKVSEDLVRTIKFRKKLEKEGGDDWPNIELEMDIQDSYEELTYADIEREIERSKRKEKELCG